MKINWKWISFWLACTLIGTWIGIATAAPAHSATVRMYTPGGAPCAGVCTLPWAAKEFDVPIGEPQRMIIPAGTTIVKMSYGKDGKPYWLSESAVFAEDQPGQGYAVEGTNFWMVQIDECQNWALVVLAPPGSMAWLTPTALTTTVITSTPPWSPPWGPPVGPPPPCCGWTPEPPPPPCCAPPPPTPPAVPIPASMVLLLGALGFLPLLKRRRTA